MILVHKKFYRGVFKRLAGFVGLAGLLLCAIAGPGYGLEVDAPQKFRLSLDAVKEDYKNFYSLKNVLIMGGSLGLAGVMANSSVDEEFQDWYQRELVTETTDDIAEVTKHLGNWHYAVPGFFAAALLGQLDSEWPALAPVGEWGRRSSRTLLVGEPLMYSLQRITGGSRPVEGNGSDWDPFNDDNGVSGHAFIGAIPFLSAAGMTENGIGKALWYTASALPALSRINDDRHYLSQAALGWWLAFLADRSVQKTEQEMAQMTMLPWALPEGGGIVVVGRF